MKTIKKIKFNVGSRCTVATEDEITRGPGGKLCFTKSYFQCFGSVFIDPDPAKNFNPDPSYFLTLSENNVKLFYN